MFQMQYVTAMFKSMALSLGILFFINSTVDVIPFTRAQDLVTAQSNSKLDLHIVKAKSITVQNPVRGTGTIFAHKTSKIGPLVEGQVTRVHVKVGDRVAKGSPLFEIDPENYRLIYEEALARLSIAEAQLMNVKPSYERAKKLYQNKSTTLALLEKATSALAVVRAEVASAKVGVARTKRDIENTIAYAPFDSVVTFRYIDEGIYLSNRVPGSNSAVVEIQKIDVVIAIVQIPVRELEKIRVGAPVKLRIDGISNSVDAKISVINDKVDISTRTVEVRIDVQNDNYNIKPGLFVQAEIQPESRQVIVIPRHVVQGSPGAHFIFIPVNGRAVRKDVAVSDYDAEFVEITSDLKIDVSILSGTSLPTLTDGMKIGEIDDVAG